MPVDQFFEKQKQYFLQLEYVVVPENLDDGILYGVNEITDVSSS